LSNSDFIKKLTELILKKITNQYKTIIRIVDFDNFIVIKGLTTSNELLNIEEIISELKSEYPHFFVNRERVNTIDIIEYGVDEDKIKDAITTKLIIASELEDGINF
jgi:hypothetical protein